MKSAVWFHLPTGASAERWREELESLNRSLEADFPGSYVLLPFTPGEAVNRLREIQTQKGVGSIALLTVFIAPEAGHLDGFTANFWNAIRETPALQAAIRLLPVLVFVGGEGEEGLELEVRRNEIRAAINTAAGLPAAVSVLVGDRFRNGLPVSFPDQAALLQALLVLFCCLPESPRWLTPHSAADQPPPPFATLVAMSLSQPVRVIAASEWRDLFREITDRMLSRGGDLPSVFEPAPESVESPPDRKKIPEARFPVRNIFSGSTPEKMLAAAAEDDNPGEMVTRAIVELVSAARNLQFTRSEIESVRREMGDRVIRMADEYVGNLKGLFRRDEASVPDLAAAIRASGEAIAGNRLQGVLPKTILGLAEEIRPPLDGLARKAFSLSAKWDRLRKRKFFSVSGVIAVILLSLATVVYYFARLHRFNVTVESFFDLQAWRSVIDRIRLVSLSGLIFWGLAVHLFRWRVRAFRVKKAYRLAAKACQDLRTYFDQGARSVLAGWRDSRLKFIRDNFRAKMNRLRSIRLQRLENTVQVLEKTLADRDVGLSQAGAESRLARELAGSERPEFPPGRAAELTPARVRERLAGLLEVDFLTGEDIRTAVSGLREEFLRERLEELREEIRSQGRLGSFPLAEVKRLLDAVDDPVQIHLPLKVRDDALREANSRLYLLLAPKMRPEHLPAGGWHPVDPSPRCENLIACKIITGIPSDGIDES